MGILKPWYFLGMGLTRKRGRPRIDEPRTAAEPPSAEEKKVGSVFDCPGCEQLWPLRLKHPREDLCLECGRKLGRERKRAQALRAAGIDAPNPSVPKRTRPAQPRPSSAEADRMALTATQRRGRRKPGSGLVRF